jgi:hypothetical protein
VVDGERIFMRRCVFTEQATLEQDLKRYPTLYCESGMLDDSGFNRIGWALHGWSEKGRRSLLNVCRGNTAFGIVAWNCSPDMKDMMYVPGRGSPRLQRWRLRPETGRRGSADDVWNVELPVLASALVYAGGSLLAGGSPEVFDAKDPFAAWEARRGGRILHFDAKSGKSQCAWECAAPPVWNGLAVAYGRLYAVLKDGSVACWR